MADISVSNTFVQASGQEGTPVALVNAIKGGWLGVADETARDALLSTMLQAGQVVLVEDVEELHYWTGAAWVGLSVGGASVTEVATYGALPGTADAGSLVVVLDASGDPAITSGPATYVRTVADAWLRLTPATTVHSDMAEIFWIQDDVVSMPVVLRTEDVTIVGAVAYVSGSVFTSVAGTITLDIQRSDDDESILSTAVDVEALSLGVNTLTIEDPGEAVLDLDAGVGLVAILTSTDEDMAGGSIHVQISSVPA